VTRFDPHVLVHVGVWEPDSRVPAGTARSLTDQMAKSMIGAAAECRSLEHVVVRSGIEIYGRGPSALTRPDESAPLLPTTRFGLAVAEIESVATAVGERIGVSVGALRFAPVLGPHVPAPLGRLLRQPVVPFDALTDPGFALLHLEDAAAALVAAASVGLAEPVNVVASGGITARQAARRGQRVPLPLVGPQWNAARPLSWLFGAPMPQHVTELLRKGRFADNGRMMDLLGVTPQRSTGDVIDDLYAWPSIIRQPARVQVA
jgi:UDP-glucose 4-epimerase